ncbi:unnamed protein product [Caretta caretta]
MYNRDAICPDIQTDFMKFYDASILYLEKWFDFSTTGYLFNTQCLNIKVNRAFKYKDLSAAMTAVNLQKTVDLDQLYDEYCVIKDINSKLEPGTKNTKKGDAALQRTRVK